MFFFYWSAVTNILNNTLKSNMLHFHIIYLDYAKYFPQCLPKMYVK